MILRCWWGGVGLGGHVNVPCTSYIKVCYAAKICGIVATLLVTTLQRSLVLLLRDMILRCWWGGVGLWGHVNVPCTSYIKVCYATKICGIVVTLLVTTLLLSLLRYLLLRCWDLWDRCWLPADCQLVTVHALQRWRWKAKKRASNFSRFSNHQISTALW